MRPIEHCMKHVLVIDDAATFRRGVARMLRRMGFVVQEAGDGAAGVAELAARPSPDLVMVDCCMPGMTGLEVIAHIRRDRAFDATRLLLVTGLEDGVAGELALMAGADAVLLKPFREAALLAQLDVFGLMRNVA
jgi:CheY-like chemotaxis protein